MSEIFFPHGSGAELATYLYAQLLRKEGCSIVVVTNRFAGEPEASKCDGFDVYRLPLLKSGRSVKYSILLHPEVLLTSFMHKCMDWADVIYIPRFWYSAIPLARIRRKPVIVHFHDYIAVCPLTNLYDSNANRICSRRGGCSSRCVYAYERKRRSSAKAAQSALLNLAIWPLLRRLTDMSNAFVCVSNAQRTALIENRPSLASKIRVLYNPVPELDQVGIDGNGFGYFGGASPSKGFAVLLKALRQLGRLSYTVHGTNFQNPEATTKMLSKWGFVAYGRLKPDEVARLYPKIRGVLVPSVVPETFSYVVAEALLRGRLVIASKVGAIPELVHGCKGVWLFDPGDFGQLAEKMKLVHDLTGETACDLGLNNRETFAKLIDNSKILRGFLELCNSLTSAS